MGFVERNNAGEIVSWFRCEQPDRVLDPIDDDDPSVVTFLNPTMVPETISDRQFFQRLAIQGVITNAEALAAVKTGDIPAALQQVLNLLPTEEQFDAEMLISGATSFNRNHPTTLKLGTALQWTSAQMDELWINASKL
ncbi:hypothetical protein ACVILK_000744 [Bradyrhizobium embrapense]